VGAKMSSDKSYWHDKCSDETCSNYEENLTDDVCYGHKVSTASICKDIIALSKRLETEKDLWDAYKAINSAFHVLSAKHTIARYEEENDAGNGTE